MIAAPAASRITTVSILELRIDAPRHEFSRDYHAGHAGRLMPVKDSNTQLLKLKITWPEPLGWRGGKFVQDQAEASMS
jgi:hypothetical protein